MTFCVFVEVWGDPGAWVTLDEVTVNTFSFPDRKLRAPQSFSSAGLRSLPRSKFDFFWISLIVVGHATGRKSTDCKDSSHGVDESTRQPALSNKVACAHRDRNRR